MKKHLLLALLAAASPLLLRAADPLGAPQATLAPGQFAAGIEYSYAEMDLVKVRPDGKTLPIKIEDMNTAYLSLSMGATEWLEFFVRIGGITMDGERQVDQRRWIKDWDYDYDEELIYGGGLRLTLGSVGNVTFGAVASYSYAEFDGDYVQDYISLAPNRAYVAYSEFGSIDAQLQQITVGLGATWQLMENLALYGGALMHHVRLEQEIRYLGGDEERGEDTESNVFKNDDGSTMLGGYAGIRVGLTEATSLSIEGSLTEDTFGGSVLLGMSF